MTYPFSEDHDMIREAANGFLQDWYDGGKGPERVYQSGKAFDADAWTSFAGDMGMGGIAIEETYGGSGLGDLGRVVVMEEIGASLCAMPFLSSCAMAAEVLKGFGEPETQAALLPKIASGKNIMTYAYGNRLVDCVDGKLSGTMKFVADAAYADFILFSYYADDEVEILALPRGMSGLTVTLEKTMDPTRSFGTVTLDNANRSDAVFIGRHIPEDFEAIFNSSIIALAAESLGGAQKCLDMTLEYTAQRVQFDRPIASFQAVKHRCADMFVQIEAARSAVYWAAIAKPEDKKEAAMIAKAYATDTFFDVAGHAIQLHGGIGFTWEYPLHFFFKRARANRMMFGSSSHNYNCLGDAIFWNVT